MSLATGQRLGRYEIESAIGAGGMGEVYRARDTRLDRTVAIKVLPASLADDEQFRGRFDREARAISSLNHPHICALFDVGTHEGMSFLVMEHLDGESLEARLAARGGTGLPLRDALTIAIGVASALDAAHRAGIVHRDLKPGNVMLTKSGAKLLDFGLAKTGPVIGPAKAGHYRSDGRVRLQADVTGAVTVPPAITEQGTILGTFQYMAPEQIEGLEADARTDIFAFGALLFEMLTGKRVFEGKSRASLIGSILKDEPPPVSRVQPLSPASLDRIVATCLEKEPDDRWQTARDLLRELKWAAEGGSSIETQAGMTAPAKAGHDRQHTAPWAIAIAALLVAGTMLVLWAPWRKEPAPPLVRLSGDVGGVSLNNVGVPGNNIALSPQGDLLAFVGQPSQNGSSGLYIRRLDQLQAIPLAGTNDARNPFFSPDGKWVAFFQTNRLKKVPVAGGAVLNLCDAPNNRGGDWVDDGTIVLSPNNLVGLQRVSAAGGSPQPLTVLADGEVSHRWPQMLPGRRAVVYTAAAEAGNLNNANIVVQSLPGGARKVVQQGGHYGRYLMSGHLVWVHSGTLFAAPFDLDRLAVSGPAVPVLEGVSANTGTGAAQLTVSARGTLAYVTGQAGSGETPITWIDRGGKTSPLRAMASDWSDPQFSPDGTQLAADVIDRGRTVVSVFDSTRDTLTYLMGAGSGVKPVWTPDGRRIAFQVVEPGGTMGLFWQRADGSGERQQLTATRTTQLAGSWHPGGRLLAFTEQSPQTAGDLKILELEGDEASGWRPGKITTFLGTPANEQEPIFSPDGRWIAYHSNDPAVTEVYVRRFPGPGGPWQISTGGGLFPMWSHTRPELLYQGTGGQILSATYRVEGESFRADKPVVWSPRRYVTRPRFRSVALHPDGNRVAAAAEPENEASEKQGSVVFVFNFFDELRRIAPVPK